MVVCNLPRSNYVLIYWTSSIMGTKMTSRNIDSTYLLNTSSEIRGEDGRCAFADDPLGFVLF